MPLSTVLNSCLDGGLRAAQASAREESSHRIAFLTDAPLLAQFLHNVSDRIILTRGGARYRGSAYNAQARQSADLEGDLKTAVDYYLLGLCDHVIELIPTTFVYGAQLRTEGFLKKPRALRHPSARCASAPELNSAAEGAVLVGGLPWRAAEEASRKSST